jgi:predicted nucleotidyltransferase component of viral defense system
VKVAFLGLPDSERRLYIEEAAARRGVSAVIIEKDFWVSWMLAVLFRSEFAGSLVFKGGTSLSKVFGQSTGSRRTSTLRLRLRSWASMHPAKT